MFILVNTSSRNKIYDRFSFSDFTKTGFWERVPLCEQVVKFSFGW